MNSIAEERTAGRAGLTAVGIFLVFGFCMAAIAGGALLWPGTVLDKLWTLNEPAYRQLSPIGGIVGSVFLGMSALLALAALGWFKRRRWGWRLTVAIIVTQVAGDFVNLLRRDWVRGGTGIVIAAALLLYLIRRQVQAAFR